MQHILIKDKYGFFFYIVGDFFWGEEEGKFIAQREEGIKSKIFLIKKKSFNMQEITQ